jgi:hypothetical protein
MFKDLELSRDLNTEFLKKNAGGGTEKLHVMVLQHSSWPTYKQAKVDLPPAVRFQTPIHFLQPPDHRRVAFTDARVPHAI